MIPAVTLSDSCRVPSGRNASTLDSCCCVGVVVREVHQVLFDFGQGGVHGKCDSFRLPPGETTSQPGNTYDLTLTKYYLDLRTADVEAVPD